MTDPGFVDTNILVYADDRSDPKKQATAQQLTRRLLTSRTGKLSLQVLQEYFTVATRKLSVPAAAARRRVEIFSSLDVVLLQVSDVLAAIDLHRLHEFSLWDALIVRAALISGCRTLYSEDLQAGFRIENLTVVNPFLD